MCTNGARTNGPSCFHNVKAGACGPTPDMQQHVGQRPTRKGALLHRTHTWFAFCPSPAARFALAKPDALCAGTIVKVPRPSLAQLLSANPTRRRGGGA